MILRSTIETELIFRLINKQIPNVSASRRQHIKLQVQSGDKPSTNYRLAEKQEAVENKSPFTQSIETVLLYLHVPDIKYLLKSTNGKYSSLLLVLKPLRVSIPFKLRITFDCILEEAVVIKLRVDVLRTF